MIHIVSGDLLQSDCQAIGHQCNCMGIMGAGIAKQLKQYYPEVLKADKDFAIPFGVKRLGHISYTWAKDVIFGDRLIFNLYGQHRYGRNGTHTNIPALRQAIERAIQLIQPQQMKFGLPFGIGSGLAGGNWDKILDMLENISDTSNQDIYLYRLSKS